MAKTYTDRAGVTLDAARVRELAARNIAGSMSFDDLLESHVSSLGDAELREWAGDADGELDPDDDLTEAAARNMRGSISSTELREHYLDAQRDAELLQWATDEAGEFGAAAAE